MIKGVTDRRDALDFAIRWTEARGGAQAATSTDLVKAAAIIESYLTGSLQVCVLGSDVDGNGRTGPINGRPNCRDEAKNVRPVGLDPIVGSIFPFADSNGNSDGPDKTFPGHLVNTHKASSSAQGGEKPERGATLSGDETVTSRCSCDLCRRVHGSRDGAGVSDG